MQKTREQRWLELLDGLELGGFMDISPFKIMLTPEIVCEAFDAILVSHPRAAAIVQSYYGLRGEKPKILEDIASELKRSRERVRQLRKLGIRRMRLVIDDRLDGVLRNLTKQFHEEAVEQKREQQEEQDILSSPIEILSLTIRTKNCLLNRGYHTVGEVTALNEAGIKRIGGFGIGCLFDLKRQLDRFGLRLNG